MKKILLIFGLMLSPPAFSVTYCEDVRSESMTKNEAFLEIKQRLQEYNVELKKIDRETYFALREMKDKYERENVFDKSAATQLLKKYTEKYDAIRREIRELRDDALCLLNLRD